ncbi:MAG: SAF domain-containing protein [Roseburia sp.]|nr:SAF domain-containing protein [Roseburia sp.]
MRREGLKRESKEDSKGKRRGTVGKSGSGRFWSGVIITSFIAAVTVFVVMLQLEKKLLEPYEQGIIYTAAKEIPKGMVITPENREVYFTGRSLDASCIPAGALKEPEQIKGMAALFSIEEGVLLTQGMFEQLNEITKDMEQPVIAGFKAEDLSQVAGGVLRAGDRIHIYCVEEENSVRLVWSEVYVQQVFDSSGKAISGEDRQTAAQRINVYLDGKDVERFYSGIEQGSLRVVKVWDFDSM